MLSPLRMVDRSFILAEIRKPCLFLSIFNLLSLFYLIWAALRNMGVYINQIKYNKTISRGDYMNQKKTGSFIGSMRREKGYTQNQIAEMMGISDKTVSKWECGGSLR